MTLSDDTADVSVIIPCFNADATVAESIESALSQSGIAVQVIVVDDGSTDHSLDVIKRFGSKILAISGPNRGVSHARNLGIRASAAPWLVFLDADDLLEPDTLSNRLEIATCNRADVVISDWMDFDGSQRCDMQLSRRRSVDWDLLQRDPEVATATTVWAMTGAILYSKRIVKLVGGFRVELPIIQDARFLFDAAFHGARFARHDGVVARYRIVANSLSRARPVRFARDLLTNCLGIEAMWRGRGELTRRQLEVVMDSLNCAGRNLFALGDSAYFHALAQQQRLGLALPLHSRVFGRAAIWFGLPMARRFESWFARRVTLNYPAA
jgi:glycosyltransferase involved in cell wall biosynthesis